MAVPASTQSARCFDVELIVICETQEQQIVCIREVGHTRSFPIMTGIFETTSIDLLVKGFQSPAR